MKVEDLQTDGNQKTQLDRTEIQQNPQLQYANPPLPGQPQMPYGSMPVPGQLQMGYGNMPYGVPNAQQFGAYGGFPNPQVMNPSNQIEPILTQAGLPVPPYKVPFGVIMDMESIKECCNSNIDLGTPPIWYKDGGYYKTFLPESSKDIIVAKAKYKFPSVNCSCSAGGGRGGRRAARMPQELYPLIESGPYEVDWVQGSFLEGRVSKDELQKFCDDAYEHCSDVISSAKSLYTVRNYFMLGILLGLLSLVLAVISIILIAIGITLTLSAIIISSCLSSAVNNYPPKIRQELAEFIHKEKEKLIRKGVKPRPGAGGAFIEFLPS